ncbi:Werner syndrome ATP-dependent helicase-like isoform X2 [Chrysoperla carnea]|nr:Werner syndrome ATP-dependent helicase-like isoform X2 [Chrysoperla carnea]
MNSDSDEDFGNYSEEEILNNSFSSQDETGSQDDSFYEPPEKYLKVLSKCFGHQKFRPMQWNIINTALNNKRDQCIIMATGSGKSLCFQYPSVYSGGCTLVISPLISLMEDQVLSLQVAGIPSCFLGTAQKNSSLVIDEILQNKYRLIYLTPEYCTGEGGEYLFNKMKNVIKFTLIAIDEAHCISKWGHDFRSSYRSLGKLRSLLPDVPMMAVTATATEQVQKDICHALKMRNPKLRCTGFDRPNLYFEILSKSHRDVAELLRPYLEECGNGSTIIYTLTKKEAESVSLTLNNNGIRCETYHAGIPMKKRKEVHEQFSKDEIKIIVATIAFGMGIDKPDVRLVVHYGASKDIESYYQEVGRAGRDGLPSKCVTFFSKQDFVIHDFLRKSSSAGNHLEELGQKMKMFLYSTECRRKFILSYFTGKPVKEIDIKNDFCCDNCTNKKSQRSTNNSYQDLDDDGLYDFTKYCKSLLEVIELLKGKYGLGMYIKFLRGLKLNLSNDKLLKDSLYGSGAQHNEDWWKIIGRLCEEKSFLKKTKYMRAYTIELSKTGKKYLDNVQKSKDLNVMKLQPPSDVIPFLKRKSTFVDIKISVDDSDDDIIDMPVIFNKKPESTQINAKIIAPTCSKVPQSTSMQSTTISNAPIAFTQGVLKLYDENSTVAEIEYNTKLFNELKEFRNQIAYEADCRPYMVASDTALMEMVQLLPITLMAFKKANFNNFNETKIEKFGQKFVNFIQTFLQKNGTIQGPVTSSQNIIKDEKCIPLRALFAKYPNEKMKDLNASMVQTYKMFSSGKKLTQIAAERSLAVSTLGFHLTSALMNGYPIKLSDLDLTFEVGQSIVELVVGQGSPITEIRLTSLKEFLPDVDYNDLRYVLKYLEIREYADSLNQPYSDHDPELYSYYKQLKTQSAHTEVTNCNKTNNSQNYNESLSKTQSLETSNSTNSIAEKCSGESTTKTDTEGLSKQDLELIKVLESLANEDNEGNLSDTDLLESLPTTSSTDKQSSSINKEALSPNNKSDDEDELLKAPIPPLLSAQSKRKSDDDDESLLSFVSRKPRRKY